MEESGIIAGRAVLLDAARLGLRMNVFAHIRLSRHDEETLETLEGELRAHPEIVECFLMTGDEDYILRTAATTPADYERIHKEIVSRLPGVARIHSSFAIRTVLSVSG
jgi:DNA-binding Lrp family transcriptional regulator